MINLEIQRALLISIGKKIPKKMIVYAIGGTAMMLHGLKEITLDIDLVFSSKEDRQVFRNVAKSLGYDDMDARVIYSDRKSSPILIKLQDSRLDLFSLDVLGVRFSDYMIKRASQIHEFGNNLIIKPADVHDIIIMKSATDRIKDEEDVIYLINNSEIDWNIIIEEIQNQVKLGNETVILNLGHFFEMLKNKYSANVPNNVLDKLWKLLKKQAEEKIKEGKNGK